MRLIVDANIMLSAMIKDSGVRKIIISGAHELFIPEYALQETLMYIDLLPSHSQLTTTASGQQTKTLTNKTKSRCGKPRTCFSTTHALLLFLNRYITSCKSCLCGQQHALLLDQDRNKHLLEPGNPLP
ncbi:MAG: hypothetical protein J4432_05545 [DPANN group archaeon]|nr:hypothetical protein [DPANN group archaeon]